MATKKKVTKKVAKKPLSKLVKNLNRKIARANLAFKKLKPAEKRVQIARDVLDQLASKRLIARSGHWLTIPGNVSLLDEKSAVKKKDVELQTVLSGIKTCEGCALGGMFMCAVERADKLKVSDLDGFGEVESCQDDLMVEGDDAFKYLGQFFSKSQLEMIEAAFEMGKGSVIGNSASYFCYQILDPSDRMRVIMENIVVNKGTFCPDKKPESVIMYITPGFTE